MHDSGVETSHGPPVSKRVAPQRRDDLGILPMLEVIQDADPKAALRSEASEAFHVGGDPPERRRDRADDRYIERVRSLPHADGPRRREYREHAVRPVGTGTDKLPFGLDTMIPTREQPIVRGGRGRLGP
jgi:hypothetical protein